jgi:excisionase family DNA binding protein
LSNLLTVDEVANFLKVSRATVYNLIKQKNLPFVKIGRSTRFNELAISEWIKTQNKESGAQ